jgi:hypothetical protein
MPARFPVTLRRSAVFLPLLLVLGCGPDGVQPDGPTADDPVVRPAEEPAAPLQADRPREVAEVRYRISGAHEQQYQEQDNVACGITDDRFYAQNMQSTPESWSITLDVVGYEPGTHDAELQLGPPQELRMFWEGTQTDAPHGSGRGSVEITDTGEHDGWGNPVVSLDFTFQDVELERSAQTVHIDGQFRCGVLGRDDEY